MKKQLLIGFLVLMVSSLGFAEDNIDCDSVVASMGPAIQSKIHGSVRVLGITDMSRGDNVMVMLVEVGSFSRELLKGYNFAVVGLNWLSFEKGNKLFEDLDRLTNLSLLQTVKDGKPTESCNIAFEGRSMGVKGVLKKVISTSKGQFILEATEGNTGPLKNELIVGNLSQIYKDKNQ